MKLFIQWGICLAAIGMLSGCATFEKFASEVLSEIDLENLIALDSVPDYVAPVAPKPDEPKPVTVEPQIPLIGLPIDAEIADLKIYKNKTTWRIVSGMKNWKKKTVKKDVNGIIYYYHQKADGSLEGGKFDWVTPGQQTKDHKNIDGNYMKVIPKSGDTWCLVITDIEKTKRSNILTGVWP